MTLTSSVSSTIQKEGIIINEDPLLDHKLDLITARARPYLKDHLLNKISRDNCSVIINYILARLIFMFSKRYDGGLLKPSPYHTKE